MSENDRLEASAQAVGVQNEALISLTSSPQWGMLRGFIEDQVSQRMIKIMATPIADEKDKAEQNFTRGECAMGTMIVDWMETRLQVTRETVELYKQALSERGEE